MGNFVIQILGGYDMSELKAEEVVVKRKPIWKNRAVWIVGILVILFFAFKIGNSPSVPEGIGENYYSNALWAFHELNVAYEKGKFPSDEVVESISNNVRAVESDLSKYSDKEIFISGQFTKMLLGVGEGNISQVNEARANLAAVLEVDEDY